MPRVFTNVAMALGGLALSAGLAIPASSDGLVASDGRWVSREEAAATIVPETVPGPGAWGTMATSVLSEGACAAATRDPTHTAQITNCVRAEPIVGTFTTALGWSFNLPTGAQILGVRMHYFDNVIGLDPSAGLFQVESTGRLHLLTSLSPGTFMGGNATFEANLATPHTVTNQGASYMILAILRRLGEDITHGVYGFEILYRLQVSPAPATATFPLDVPTTHPYFRFVEALVSSGIATGCGPDRFCPNDPVTRGQLAVFLSVALGLHFPN